MSKKPCLLYTAIALITAITFLWNQCIWAIGFETLHSHPPDNLPQNFVAKNLIFEADLPQNLHETSPKVFCRFIEVLTKKTNFEAEITITGAKNPIQTCVTPSDNDRLGRIEEKYGTYDNKSYKWKAISYDELGRPTAYKEKIGRVSYRHFDILYNELGDVAYEKIKASAKSGWGPFKSKTKVLTEYWYGYDEYGQHEKIKENEIYRKTSSNPIGQIVKAVIGTVAAIFGGPLAAAAVGFITNVLSGADIGQALLGAAISLAAAYIGAEFAQALGFGTGFSFSPIGWSNFISNPFNVISEVIGLVDQLMVDDQGRGLFEQAFGKWGAVVLGSIQILGGMMGGAIANKSPPTGYQIFGALGRMITLTALTALGDNLNPYLKQALSGFFSAFFGGISQGLNPKGMGYEKIGEDLWAKQIGNETVYMNDKGKIIGKDIFNEQGNHICSTEIDPLTKSETFYDPQGNKVFTQLSDGKIISYDIFGNIEGILAKGTLPYWGEGGKLEGSYIDIENRSKFYNLSGLEAGFVPRGADPIWRNGELLGSKMESVFGTKYYDKDGNYAGFTPDGYTAVTSGDKIAYSYKPISENSFYIVDSDGNNQKLVTQQLDNNYIPVGEYISDDKTIEYYDSRGIKVWDRENKPNSNINLYLEDGSKWGEITTLVNKNDLISGYIFENKLTGETSLYDWTGALDSTIDAKGDYYQYNEKGETVLYVPKGFDVRRDSETQQVIDVIGYDDQGNFISQNPEGLRNYRATKENEIYFYDITGKTEIEKLYTVFDKEGTAKFIVFEDLLTGNITKYDNRGEYEGDFTPRKDAQGNIIGYKGTDKNGNQAILDKDLNIRSTLFKGTYTAYDRRDPSKIYYVLRPDSVYIVGDGDNIRFVLDVDSDTGKSMLYNPTGEFLTNDPMVILAKLNFSLLAFPADIRGKIWTDFVTIGEETLLMQKGFYDKELFKLFKNGHMPDEIFSIRPIKEGLFNPDSIQFLISAEAWANQHMYVSKYPLDIDGYSSYKTLDGRKWYDVTGRIWDNAKVLKIVFDEAFARYLSLFGYANSIYQVSEANVNRWEQFKHWVKRVNATVDAILLKKAVDGMAKELEMPDTFKTEIKKDVIKRGIDYGNKLLFDRAQNTLSDLSRVRIGDAISEFAKDVLGKDFKIEVFMHPETKGDLYADMMADEILSNLGYLKFVKVLGPVGKYADILSKVYGIEKDLKSIFEAVMYDNISMTEDTNIYDIKFSKLESDILKEGNIIFHTGWFYTMSGEKLYGITNVYYHYNEFYIDKWGNQIPIHGTEKKVSVP